MCYSRRCINLYGSNIFESWNKNKYAKRNMLTFSDAQNVHNQVIHSLFLIADKLSNNFILLFSCDLLFVRTWGYKRLWWGEQKQII